MNNFKMFTILNNLLVRLIMGSNALSFYASENKSKQGLLGRANFLSNVST
jgi:hypothetical protein